MREHPYTLTPYLRIQLIFTTHHVQLPDVLVVQVFELCMETFRLNRGYLIPLVRSQKPEQHDPSQITGQCSLVFLESDVLVEEITCWKGRCDIILLIVEWDVDRAKEMRLSISSC